MSSSMKKEVVLIPSSFVPDFDTIVSEIKTKSSIKSSVDRTEDVRFVNEMVLKHSLNVSETFRFLSALGWKMYRISKATGKRPQHVRNVLIKTKK